MTIDEFIPRFIFPHECVYEYGHYGDMNFVVPEDVPGDPGGPTKYGIDTASHPGVDIRDLTADQATQIYLMEYKGVGWSDIGGSALDVFPGNAALAFFDSREVCGLRVTWEMTQRALGLTGADVDGHPGPQTRGLIKEVDGTRLTPALIAQRRAYHHSLVIARPSLAKFLAGWLNRCNDLEQLLVV